MRRRGIPPEAIRSFCEKIGITKVESLTDVALLEHCVRDDLNKRVVRRMAVLNPLRVVIENYPENESETFEAVNNPEDESMGTRQVAFSRVIYIEREDFMEDPPKKFFRLAPGREVRLRYACYITCTDVVKDPETGEVVEVRCSYDPESRGGDTPDGRRVRGTLHWVSEAHMGKAEVRLYDRLFNVEDPAGDKDRDFKEFLNPDSLKVVTALVEPALLGVDTAQRFQFERIGYFSVDPDSRPDAPVFNRTFALRDTWTKVARPRR